MNEQIKELIPYLDKLADKLDSSAPALWALQVQQAHISFIAGLTYYAILPFLLIGWFVFTKFIFKKYKEINDCELLFAIPVVLLIAIVVIYFNIVPSIKELLTMSMNPDYWALKELLGLVKSIKSSGI